MARNPGTALELDRVRDVRIDRAAVERRAAAIGVSRPLEKQWRAAWLLRALTLMDLTTLSGDDTPGTVRRLCATARQPLRRAVLERLGAERLPIRVAAVCVYHALVPTAVDALRGSGIPVAAVSAGFPAGLSPRAQRIDEIRASVAAGAAEIDIVIDRSLVLTGDWQALYDEVRAFREACGPARMKSILATGELAALRSVARASLVCMMAGTDFIKTSTGKEAVNATLPVGLVMARCIRDYHRRTGHRVGLKPAGGLRTASQALEWLVLVREELGPAWLGPERFRFGASSLLADLGRELERYPTDRGSAVRLASTA